MRFKCIIMWQRLCGISLKMLNPLVIESFENIWIFEHTHINTSANYTYVHTYSERERNDILKLK